MHKNIERAIMVLFLFLDATVFSIEMGFELFVSVSTLTGCVSLTLTSLFFPKI